MLCISLDSEFCKDFKSVRILRIRLRNRRKISFYYILELKYHVIKQIRNYSVFMPCYAYRWIQNFVRIPNLLKFCGYAYAIARKTAFTIFYSCKIK